MQTAPYPDPNRDPRNIYADARIFHWGPDENGWASLHRGPREGCAKTHLITRRRQPS